MLWYIQKSLKPLLTVSDSLSFIRAPLALLFLQENVFLRLCAIFLAMVTDMIDGYLARRNRSTSRFGAILDPTMDKFFVYFALTIFFSEGTLKPLAMIAVLSRDIALLFYGFCMMVFGRLNRIEFRSIRWGKISTSFQFCLLIGLTLGISIPWGFYACFVVMGILALVELFQLSSPFSTRPIH